MSDYPMPPEHITTLLRTGLVIPAHPLALDELGTFDRQHQRALTRYYHAAGAGGIAVGVHTTQFSIRDHGLLEDVLRLARETMDECDRRTERTSVLIAGVVGRTEQAVDEAELARSLRYHAGLLSLGAMGNADDDELIEHCRKVAHHIPLVGFYLQPAVGGRVLGVEFWRRFVDIPNVVAIKIAPFDRYRTLDVMRAVAESGREKEIALYTGNDDSIVVDLLGHHAIGTHAGATFVRIVGGLLGHWACWTYRAVELLEEVRRVMLTESVPLELLTLARQITEANAALFDPSHGFAGSIPGIHYVLWRQGLLRSPRCLDPGEVLSPGQQKEIDRIIRCYPHLTDNDLVSRHLHEWLSE